MEDFKENENTELEPENGEEQVQNDTAPAAEELDPVLAERQELEELAALFQRELDKAREREEQGEKLISDWDDLVKVPAGGTDDGDLFVNPALSEKSDGEDEAEDEEEQDDSLCIRCGESEKQTDDDGEIISDYCEECEKERRSTHISRLASIVFVLVLAVTAFGGRELVKSSESFMSLMQAVKYESNHCYTSALDEYYAALQGGNQSGYVIQKMVNCFEKTEQSMYVSQFLEGIGYDEAELSKPQNYSLKKSAEKSDRISSTAEAADAALENATNAESGAIDYGAAMKAFDELQKDKQYDKAIIQYYRYYTAAASGKDLQAQLELLTADKGSVKKYPWLFMPSIVMTHAQLREVDKALEMCEDMKKINSEWGSAYFHEAYALRLAERYEEAAAAAEKGIEKFSGTEGGSGVSDRYALSELYRQRSIISLLVGDSKAGTEYAEKAYDAYNTLDACNLLGVCYALTGDEEKYTEIQEFLKENGYDYAEDVAAVKKGEKTAADIFKSQGGEIK